MKLGAAPRTRTVVMGLLFAAGCGGTRGKVRGVTTLQEVAAVVSVSLEFPSDGDGGQFRLGYVGIDLTFAEYGRQLGDDCPILNAEARLGDVLIPIVSSGGSSSCDLSGCANVCLKALWGGPATSVLEGMPATAALTLTDSSGQLTFALDNPAPEATVAFVGLQEGQVVHQGDSFQMAIDAVPPLDQSSIVVLDSYRTSPPAGLSAWLDQSGSRCGPYLLPGPPGNSDEWTVSFQRSNCSELTQGPAVLRVTFERPTAFADCPAGAACSGGTQVDWKALAVGWGG